MRQEVLGVLQFVGEDRRRQTLSYPVLQGDGLVETGKRNQVQDGAEGLRLDDWPGVLGDRDRGRHEMAGTFEAFSAVEDIAATGAHGGDGGFGPDRRGLVDQRSHERVRIERIADAHLAVGANQRFCEFGEARLVYEDAARRRAALAGRAHGAENDRRHGEFEIGMLVDDNGVVAAEFEQAFAHSRRDPRPDRASHGARPRKRDQGDASVVDEAFGEFGAGVVDEEADRRQIHVRQRATDDLLHRDAAQRRLR